MATGLNESDDLFWARVPFASLDDPVQLRTLFARLQSDGASGGAAANTGKTEDAQEQLLTAVTTAFLQTSTSRGVRSATATRFAVARRMLRAYGSARASSSRGITLKSAPVPVLALTASLLEVLDPSVVARDAKVCESVLTAASNVLTSATLAGFVGGDDTTRQALEGWFARLSASLVSSKAAEPLVHKALTVSLRLGYAVGSLKMVTAALPLVSKANCAEKFNVHDMLSQLLSSNRSVLSNAGGVGSPFDGRFNGSFEIAWPKRVSSRTLQAAATPYLDRAVVATDGAYLYIHDNNGLSKIGTGKQSTVAGKVYAHKDSWRADERGWLAYSGGKLYYRSTAVAPASAITIDTNSLDETGPFYSSIPPETFDGDAKFKVEIQPYSLTVLEGPAAPTAQQNDGKPASKPAAGAGAGTGAGVGTPAASGNKEKAPAADDDEDGPAQDSKDDSPNSQPPPSSAPEVLKVTDSGRGVSYDASRRASPWVFVRGQHALNARNHSSKEIVYFETLITNLLPAEEFKAEFQLAAAPPLNIGLQLDAEELDELPNMYMRSDDGRTIWNGDDSRSTWAGASFKALDVVGCGVDPESHRVFYTLNGNLLGTAFITEDPISLAAPIYPAFSLPIGASIMTNFGHSPFLFDFALLDTARHAYANNDNVLGDRSPLVSDATKMHWVDFSANAKQAHLHTLREKGVHSVPLGSAESLSEPDAADKLIPRGALYRSAVVLYEGVLSAIVPTCAWNKSRRLFSDEEEVDTRSFSVINFDPKTGKFLGKVTCPEAATRALCTDGRTLYAYLPSSGEVQLYEPPSVEGESALEPGSGTAALRALGQAIDTAAPVAGAQVILGTLVGLAQNSQSPTAGAFQPGADADSALDNLCEMLSLAAAGTGPERATVMIGTLRLLWWLAGTLTEGGASPRIAAAVPLLRKLTGDADGNIALHASAVLGRAWHVLYPTAAEQAVFLGEVLVDGASKPLVEAVSGALPLQPAPSSFLWGTATQPRSQAIVTGLINQVATGSGAATRALNAIVRDLSNQVLKGTTNTAIRDALIEVANMLLTRINTELGAYADPLEKSAPVTAATLASLLDAVVAACEDAAVGQALLNPLATTAAALDKAAGSSAGGGAALAASNEEDRLKVVETAHPFGLTERGKEFTSTVTFPKALNLELRFDSRCELSDTARVSVFALSAKDGTPFDLGPRFNGPSGAGWHAGQRLLVPGSTVTFVASNTRRLTDKETEHFGLRVTVAPVGEPAASGAPAKGSSIRQLCDLAGGAVGSLVAALVSGGAAAADDKAGAASPLLAGGLESDPSALTQLLVDFVQADEGTHGGKLAHFLINALLKDPEPMESVRLTQRCVVAAVLKHRGHGAKLQEFIAGDFPKAYADKTAPPSWLADAFSQAAMATRVAMVGLNQQRRAAHSSASTSDADIVRERDIFYAALGQQALSKGRLLLDANTAKVAPTVDQIVTFLLKSVGTGEQMRAKLAARGDLARTRELGINTALSLLQKSTTGSALHAVAYIAAGFTDLVASKVRPVSYLVGMEGGNDAAVVAGVEALITTIIGMFSSGSPLLGAALDIVATLSVRDAPFMLAKQVLQQLFVLGSENAPEAVKKHAVHTMRLLGSQTLVGDHSEGPVADARRLYIELLSRSLQTAGTPVADILIALDLLYAVAETPAGSAVLQTPKCLGSFVALLRSTNTPAVRKSTCRLLGRILGSTTPEAPVEVGSATEPAIDVMLKTVTKFMAEGVTYPQSGAAVATKGPAVRPTKLDKERSDGICKLADNDMQLVKDRTDKGFCMCLADNVIPDAFESPYFYFEITLTEFPNEGMFESDAYEVCLGLWCDGESFAESRESKQRYLGKNVKKAYAFSTSRMVISRGRVLEQGRSVDRFESKQGMVMGLLWDKLRGAVSLIIDGQSRGTVFKNVFGRFYPAVSMYTKVQEEPTFMSFLMGMLDAAPDIPLKVTVNFGDKPFKGDAKALLQDRMMDGEVWRKTISASHWPVLGAYHVSAAVGETVIAMRSAMSTSEAWCKAIEAKMTALAPVLAGEKAPQGDEQSQVLAVLGALGGLVEGMRLGSRVRVANEDGIEVEGEVADYSPLGGSVRVSVPKSTDVMTKISSVETLPQVPVRPINPNAVEALIKTIPKMVVLGAKTGAEGKVGLDIQLQTLKALDTVFGNMKYCGVAHNSLVGLLMEMSLQEIDSKYEVPIGTLERKYIDLNQELKSLSTVATADAEALKNLEKIGLPTTPRSFFLEDEEIRSFGLTLQDRIEIVCKRAGIPLSSTAELQEAFSQLDKDGDGVLTLKEIEIGAKRGLFGYTEDYKAHARVIYDLLDKDSSGEIDFIEYLRFVIIGVFNEPLADAAIKHLAEEEEREKMLLQQTRRVEFSEVQVGVTRLRVLNKGKPTTTYFSSGDLDGTRGQIGIVAMKDPLDHSLFLTFYDPSAGGISGRWFRLIEVEYPPEDDPSRTADVINTQIMQTGAALRTLYARSAVLKFMTNQDARLPLSIEHLGGPETFLKFFKLSMLTQRQPVNKEIQVGDNWEDYCQPQLRQLQSKLKHLFQNQTVLSSIPRNSITARALEEMRKKPDGGAAAAPAATPQSVIASGKSEREGYLNKLGGGVLKSWQKRFFVLGEDMLVYMKKEGETKDLSAIDLENVQRVNQTAIKKKTFTFELVTEAKTYNLQANSKEEMDAWIAALSSRVMKVSGANVAAVATRARSDSRLIPTAKSEATIVGRMAGDVIAQLGDSLVVPANSMLVECEHPYKTNSVLERDIVFPGAEALMLVFDPQSETEIGSTRMSVFADREARTLLREFVGAAGHNVWPTTILQTDRISIRWRSGGANSNNLFGFKVTVTAVQRGLTSLAMPNYYFSMYTLEWLLSLKPLFAKPLYTVESYNALVHFLKTAKTDTAANKRIGVARAISQMLGQYAVFEAMAKPDLSRLDFLKAEVLALREFEVNDWYFHRHSELAQHLIELLAIAVIIDRMPGGKNTLLPKSADEKWLWFENLVTTLRIMSDAAQGIPFNKEFIAFACKQHDRQMRIEETPHPIKPDDGTFAIVTSYDFRNAEYIEGFRLEFDQRSHMNKKDHLYLSSTFGKPNKGNITGKFPKTVMIKKTSSLYFDTKIQKGMGWGYRCLVTPTYNKMWMEESASTGESLAAQGERYASNWDAEKDQKLVQFFNKEVTMTPFSCKPEEVRVVFRSINQPWESLEREITDTKMEKYHPLGACDRSDLQTRYLVLREFNKCVAEALPFINMRYINEEWSMANALGAVRPYLFYDLKDEWFTTSFKAAVVGTISLGKPQITLDRQSSSEPLFIQAYKQLKDVDPARLVVEERAFMVNFANEGSIDAGGPYREAMAQFSEDIVTTTNLFIASPNKEAALGQHQDATIPNSNMASVRNLEYFEFIGKLFGIALKSGDSIPVEIADMIWKQLVGLRVDLNDLRSVDEGAVNFLDSMTTEMLAMQGVDEATFADMIFETFTARLSSGRTVELKSGGAEVAVDFRNREEYARLLQEARLNEFNKQVAAIQQGMRKMLPTGMGAFLNLMSPADIKRRICGSADFDVDLLKRNTEYSYTTSEGAAHIRYFWEALESFSNEERSQYLRFVWGRARLPPEGKFTQKHVIDTLPKFPADGFLPESHTCFFKLDLPQYTSVEITRAKLLLAITACKDIDNDFAVGGGPGPMGPTFRVEASDSDSD